MSISILHTRFFGKLDDHLKYHVNGGYLRGYTQSKHKWSDKVWDMINMTAFGKNFKSISLTHQPAHLKFIHNQLPLGDRQYQQSSVKDENLKLCPTCRLHEENIHHFLHCHKNPNRAKSIEAMLTTILKDNHPSRPAFASCIEQHLQRPRQQIQCTAHQLSSHFNDTLQTAIEEQMQIGWHHLLLGYMSKKWLMLSSMDTSTGTLNLAAGRNRIHSALKAITLLVRELWLGRNQVLHQHKDEKDQEIYSMESAELRHYHSNPKLLQSSDQHYCNNMTLNKLLQSHPSVRRRWLKRVKTSRAAYLKDGQNQQTISKYMTPIPQTRGAHDKQETRLTQPTHRERHKDTNTTQQFPGRPPDILQELTQNPPPSQA
jgi:hypothetical protein